METKSNHEQDSGCGSLVEELEYPVTDQNCFIVVPYFADLSREDYENKFGGTKNFKFHQRSKVDFSHTNPFQTFRESGEEWMLLTVKVSAEEVNCFGSAAGRKFGIEESDLTRKFLQYCQTNQLVKSAKDEIPVTKVEGVDRKEEEIKPQLRKRGKVEHNHKEVIKSEVPDKIENDDNEEEEEDKEYGLDLDESDDWIPDGERRETEKKRMSARSRVSSRTLQSVGSKRDVKKIENNVVATRRSLRLRTQGNAPIVKVKTKKKGKKNTKTEINSKPIKRNLKAKDKNLEKATTSNQEIEKNDEICEETSDKNSESDQIQQDNEKTPGSLKKFQCKICKKDLAQSHCLKRHMLLHTSSKKHICPICDKAFLRKEDVLKHVKTHSNIKPFSCTDCSQSFKTFQGYKHHRVQYHSVNPKDLPHPGIEKRRQLQQQKSQATKTGAYTCSVCKTVLKTRFSLKRHMIGHDPSKKNSFRCGTCGRGFCRKEDMKKHSKMHSDIKPYECTLCNKKLKTLSGKRTHDIIYHGDKGLSKIEGDSFLCKFCGGIYNSFFSLSRHLLRHRNAKKLSGNLEELVEARDDQPIMPILPIAIPNVGETTNEDVQEAKDQSSDPVKSEYSESVISTNTLGDEEVAVSVYKVSEDEMKDQNIENAEIDTSRSLELQSGAKMDEAPNELQKLIQESLQQASNKDDEITKLTCDKCGKKFKSKDKFNNHALIHNEKGPVYNCDLCGRLFRKPMSLFKHRKLHDNSGTYTCKACGKKFTTIDRLRRHAKIHKEVKDFICPDCNKGFTEKRNLEMHMLSHTKEKAFVCDQCGKAFRMAQQLRSHLLRHSGERPFECKVCKKTFTLRDCLRNHMAVHSDFKKYMCHTCGRRFKQQSSLLTHQHSHSSDPTHYCKECGRGCKSANALKSHYVSYHMKPEDYESGKIKCFTCKFCGKAFGDRQDRDRHLTVHTGEKPHSCDICGKKFSDRSNMRAHFRNHNNEKPHKCSVCAKGFLFNRDLKKHMAVHDQNRDKDANKTNSNSNIDSNSNETSVVVHQQTLTIDPEYIIKQHYDEANTAAHSVIIEEVPRSSLEQIEVSSATQIVSVPHEHLAAANAIALMQEGWFLELQPNQH